MYYQKTRKNYFLQLYAIEHFGLVLDYNVRVTLIYLEQIPMKDISDNLNVKGQRTSRTSPAGTCKVKYK